MKPLPQEIRCKGLGVSEGVVIGQVLRLHDGTQHVYHLKIDEAEVEKELRRFRNAVGVAGGQLQTIKEQAEHRFGQDHAYIFDAHQLILEDKKLLADIEQEISGNRVNAEWAIKVVGDRLLFLYSQIKDNYLGERVSDIEDVMRRLLVALSGKATSNSELSQEAIIVSHDLLPSAVAELDLEHARALVTDTGGWTSHTAILARGVGLPAVVGLRDFYRRTKTGDTIIVDSRNSEVILHPSATTLEQYRAKSVSQSEARVGSEPPAAGPAVTKDGTAVTLRANVELASEFDSVKAFGASGVGLYRSEFLLAKRDGFVSEEEQREAYEKIARVAGAEGAVIRLFDLSGDTFREQAQQLEKNPALGLRAIRFVLANEEVMRAQIRAILRASATGALRIVLPMVADVSDVRRAQAIIEDERKKLGTTTTVSVGAMIEVPSAVFMAEKIARIVDFFELGTNDLVQYTLAVDRGNDEVADWFRTLHPAVLHSIDHSLKAARNAKIPAIVCGEMASTPAYVVLLVGLGATDLSMTPAAIPRVRRTIMGIDARTAYQIVTDCLDCATADEVENLVRDRLTHHWPELFNSTNLPARRPIP
ncbi:MAG TPA: phosphoenolpyruvate--protein phosphotransferase [Pyrinomonadaceae bacterium]|nr:phosphoenolpyruvate--protein phosphotransferase [Pyrinomonadaceae bacterium]